MRKSTSVSAICDNLAALASARGHKHLSMWLKLASNEAYLNKLLIEAEAYQRIGIFDWDVSNNVNYLNTVGAGFFGRDESFAASGAPNEAYTRAIHPDDISSVQDGLARCIKEGGPFFAEYRTLADGRLRWLRADGHCSIDYSGRPVRMLGSMVDITREKLST